MNKRKVIHIGIIMLAVMIIFIVVIVAVSKNNAKESENSSSNFSATETSSLSTAKKQNQNSLPLNNIEILVNAENPIPDDWTVDLVQLRNGNQIDRQAYASLQKMMDDARAKGWNPLICSSYRSKSYQQKLFDNRVERMKNQGMSEKEAIQDTEKWIAIPGTSEHETGLAVDIVTIENQNLDNSQLESECQKWLMEHCYDYGFIHRYPEDKTEITGIDFEPWHYRYVGYDTAQYIKEKGICLEEYKNNFH